MKWGLATLTFLAKNSRFLVLFLVITSVSGEVGAGSAGQLMHMERELASSTPI